MGAPYHETYYESAELAAELRAWWGEPELIECALAEFRIAGLREWMHRQHAPNREAIGAKHPLLTLSANDVLDAWGADTKILWAHRDLDESIASLARVAWVKCPHLAQSYLWLKASEFCGHHPHLKVRYDEITTDPIAVVQRLVEYLGMGFSDEQIREAAGVVQLRRGLISTPDSKRAATRLRTRTDIINWLIARNGHASYLEIGVGDGRHFHSVHCREKVSVDPGGASPTHRMTSDEFFATNHETFDLIFIDGLHHCEVVARDLRDALQILNPGGKVVCHDLNPRPEAAPKIAPTDDEMTWENFTRERRAWLNLLPLGEIGCVLFGEEEAGQGLTVVTLWRGDWNAAQVDLLRWMAKEKFPGGTRFVWVAPKGSMAEIALENAWAEFDGREQGYHCEFIPTPAVTQRPIPPRRISGIRAGKCPRILRSAKAVR